VATVAAVPAATSLAATSRNAPRAPARSTTESPLVRVLIVVTAVAWLTLFLLMPLLAVFVEALRDGVGAYMAAVVEPDALAAIRLTLTVAVIAVPLNMVFGLAAAWAVAKFEFRGKSLLITLIDMPFSVSP
jgi:sulfate transport system permease protein